MEAFCIAMPERMRTAEFRAGMIGSGLGDIYEETSLIEWEQHVNERLGTDPAPGLSPDLLPESGGWLPMRWVRVPQADLCLLADGNQQPGIAELGLLTKDGEVLFPIHPLIEQAFPHERIIHAGRFAVSASYRTVFYEPEPGGPLCGLAGPAESIMLKLHLDDVLPGIAGDRRLTVGKVRKCVTLSRVLPESLSKASAPHPLRIMREQLGLLCGDRGALVRVVPRSGAFPVFSLYSRDNRSPDKLPILIEQLDRLAGGPSGAARSFGALLAEPLVRGVLAGFEQGFSLELHAQNAVAVPGSERLIDQILFRDLESVVFFPELRSRRGLSALPLDVTDPELVQPPRNPVRWFNRNIDHDIGRILRWSLFVLEREGYFGRRERSLAITQTRRVVRRLVAEFGLAELARQGRWFPYSRSPYGTGRRPGHYYRTLFR